MAALSAIQATIAGATVTPPSAAGGGDTVPPGCAVLVNNGGGGSITVTIDWPGNTKYGPANPDPTVAVAAGAQKFIGPFGTDLADPSDGLVHLTYSGVTSVTVTPLTV